MNFELINKETESVYTIRVSHSSIRQLWTALKPWENKFYANGMEYSQSILRDEIGNLIGESE